MALATSSTCHLRTRKLIQWLSLRHGRLVPLSSSAGLSRNSRLALLRGVYAHNLEGEPPPEMELEVQWQEHDLGDYSTIVPTWEDAMRGAPREYLEECEEALIEYENR